MNPISVNTAQAGGAPNIANAAIARLAASTSSRTPLTAQNPILTQSHLAGPAARVARETSADANKRRRLNSSLTCSLPTQSSGLRQSSIGPAASTPKAGTPGPVSRAGSAQPTRPAATRKAPGATKKVAPHQVAAAAASAPGRKRVRTSILPSKKGDRRRQLARERGRGSMSASPTPSTSRASTSPTPSSMPHGHDGATDTRATHRGQPAAASEEDGDEGDMDAEGEEDDTQVYCTCQRVSFGDMVACDNEDCKYQWFHWGCVGLKEEPKGEWLCPFCRKLPEQKIVKAK